MEGHHRWMSRGKGQDGFFREGSSQPRNEFPLEAFRPGRIFFAIVVRKGVRLTRDDDAA